MPDRGDRWSLADLIDFETELSSWDGKAGRRHVARRGRARVMLGWLRERESGETGRRWMAAIGLAEGMLCALMLASGAIAVWGVLDRETGGVNVIWLMIITLGLPWLLFVFGIIAWLMRGRVAGLGLLGHLIANLSLRLSGKDLRDVAKRVKQSADLTRVLGWRLAAISQRIAASFHLGAVFGLGAMVLFRRVGFFWETTTERSVEEGLQRFVEVLGAPWSWHFGLPDVAASQIQGNWMEGGQGWWVFLLLALLVWGVVPRFLFALVASMSEGRKLANLDFQSPRHRKLWRALTEVRRGEEPKGPVDGALVIAVGGTELNRDVLRPFLLRRLRMNPTAWESLDVLDASREQAARSALANAPAGIVLFAEGWSLAPRQMTQALKDVRALAEERPLVLVVGNCKDGTIEVVSEEERQQWEDFMDGAESETELLFYESS